jgi:hypothetical protein
MSSDGTGRLDRSEHDLVFAEEFTGAELDAGKWVDHYLPHWTTPERSAARYDLRPGTLRLRIDADQPAWRPEDGELRVSSIQTASFSGPVGSSRGTHRHRPDLRVRTATPTRRLYAPSGGLVEARLRATPDPTCMLAVWLVGVEEISPDQSGEVCIAELYGRAVGPGGSTVRSGIKAHHDPRLTTDMADLALDVEGALTGWFEGRPGVAVVRPDRYLAALTTAEGLNEVVGRLRTMLGRSAKDANRSVR